MPPRRSNRVAEFAAVVVAYVAAVAAAFSPPAPDRATPRRRPPRGARRRRRHVGGRLGAVVGDRRRRRRRDGRIGRPPPRRAGPRRLRCSPSTSACRSATSRCCRAISVGLSLNVLAWAHLDGFFGLTAILGIGAAILVFVFGIRRRPKRIRRIAWIAAGAVGVASLVAVAGLGLAAAQARTDLEQGQDAAERGIDLLERRRVRPGGRPVRGRIALAGQRQRSPDRRVRRRRRRWCPVVSQHRAAAIELSDAGADATARIATALRQVDPATLRVAGWRHRSRRRRRARRAVRRRRRRARRALGRRRRLALAVAGPAARRRARHAQRTHRRQRAQAAERRDAVALAPRMLGADGAAHLPRAVHHAGRGPRARRLRRQLRPADHRPRRHRA